MAARRSNRRRRSALVVVAALAGGAPLLRPTHARAADPVPAVPAAPAAPAADVQPFAGVINGDRTLVYSGPNDQFYATTRLDRGTKVKVTGAAKDFYKIVPPEGSFSFVAKFYVQKSADGATGKVTAPDLNVRAGSSLNTYKTTVQAILDKGETVTILGEQDGYYKIAPPAAAMLYVARSAIDMDSGAVATAAPAVTPRPAGGTPPVTPAPAPPTGQVDPAVPPQPPVSQPPVSQPPVSQPPVSQPPAAQPPVAQPPVAQSPVAQPPVSRPPVVQPVAPQPPVVQPPLVVDPAVPPSAPPRERSPERPPERSGTADATGPANGPSSVGIAPAPPVVTPPVVAPPVVAPPVVAPPVVAPATQPAKPLPERFDAAEAAFVAASRQPLDQQPLDGMRWRYKTLANDPALTPGMKQVVESRLATLDFRIAAKAEYVSVKAKQDEGRAKRQALQAEQLELAQRASEQQVTTYAAVGTLRVSSLQQAGNGGTLYRLTDPGTGRTVLYLRTADPKYADLLNQFVGIKGDVTEDPALGLKYIMPTAAEAVDPAKVNGTVSATIVPPSMVARATPAAAQ